MASIRKRTWKRDGVERSAWVVDYFDQAGKRRLKTFATRKEAEAWSVDGPPRGQAGRPYRQRQHHGLGGSDLWIAACEADGLEYGTIKQRKEHKRLHVDPIRTVATSLSPHRAWRV